MEQVFELIITVTKGASQVIVVTTNNVTRFGIKIVNEI